MYRREIRHTEAKGKYNATVHTLNLSVWDGDTTEHINNSKTTALE